jgi:hypothetical protein
MGAPIGNRNARKETRIFGEELRKAIAQDDRKRIRQGIEVLLNKFAEGDLPTVKEIVDRTDGKAVQGLEVAGADGETLTIEVIKRVVVDPRGTGN